MARRRAEEAGVTANTTFVTVDALDLAASPAGDGFDLVTMFDCLHDMGDPVGAARRIRAVARPGRRVHARRAARRRPRRGQPQPPRAASSTAPRPSSAPRARSPSPVRRAIGTQAGPARITAVLHEAGFRSVRIAAETPVNHVYEARD